MFSKAIVRHYKPNYAIALFLLSFAIFHYFKPSFAYGKEGEFRQFGVGYRHKTVIPVWGVSIVLAIFSYLAVLMYLRY
jgi:hypothetical protein